MKKCSISVLYVVLLINFIVADCDLIKDREFEEKATKRSIFAILSYLNADVDSTTDFSSARILDSWLKGDNLTVELAVTVTCKKTTNDCSERIANCQCFIQLLPNDKIEVKSVKCSSNPPEIEERLALPYQERSCAGCLNDIYINAEGVERLTQTILQHVQSERNRRYILLEVLKVQQEVTNQVNFILTVKIAPTICNNETLQCVRDEQEDDTYCLVKFIKEPGYEKPENIISNNCTISQTFVSSTTAPKSDINNVGPNTDKNTVHEKDVKLKKPERSENDILADLMSQIIPYDQFESSQKKEVELVQSNPVKSVESSSVHNLVDENGQPIISSSTFQEVLATEDEPISLGTDTAGEQDVTPINPSLPLHGSPSADVNANSNQNQYSNNQQTENVEVTSQNTGSEHGNSISSPVGKYESDLLEEHQSLERMRRSVVNSEKFSPREKAALENIADFVASTLDTIDDDNHKRIVLQIINVKKIRTDGLFLNMNLRIGVSKCGENDDGSHCKEDLLVDLTKFCKVQILINEDFENPKVVKSHCENEKRDPQKANRTSNVRSKRALLGGKDKIAVNDPKIQQYVGEAVNYINTKLSKGETPIQVNKVLSATSQVVSGVSYDIKVEMSSCNKNENSVDNCSNEPKICNINVWYRAWLRKRIITIDCGGSKLTFNALKSNTRTIRSIPGGWSPEPINNPRIIPHLNSVLKKMDAGSDKNTKLKIKSIISVSSQVVAGTNWEIKAKVAFSDCLKSDEKRAEECGESPDPFETVCDFKFWEKLPNKDGLRELDNIQVNCLESKLNYRNEAHSRKQRSLVGSHAAISNGDPRISKHLNKLLPQLDSHSGKEHKLKIKEILSATTQVVAGTNWNIRAKVALSNCPKTEDQKVEDCGENEQDSFGTICNFKFWERLPDKNGDRNLENIQVECDEPKLNFRSKRDAHFRKTRSVLLGGHNAVSNNDPRIGKHLNKLLPRLDSQSGKNHKLRIKEILSATSQVVAGTNWNIRAKVALSDCPKTEDQKVEDCGENEQDSFGTICNFKFWERLPDKNGDINLENIQIECDEPKLNFRSKRDAHYRKTRSVLLGGHNAVSNNDPRIGKHLNKLLPRLDSQSGKNHKLRIKEILSATSQVVAGTNWNIRAKVALSDCPKTEDKKVEDCGENKQDSFGTICNFKFWERLPDENGVRNLENVQIECDEPKFKFRNRRDIHPRKTRSVLLGGHNTVPNDDPRIEKHLNKLLPQLDSQSGKEHKLKIKEILSATSQLVAGTNWNIRAKVALSDCPKTEDKKVEDCGENKQDSFVTICNFKFWERLPDTNGVRNLEHVQIECDEPKFSFRSRRDIQSRKTRSVLLGAHNAVPNDDPRIEKHLNKLLPQLDSQSGKEHKLKIKEIISAASQVVAGRNWNIRAKVTLTNCLKSDTKKISECEDNRTPFVTECLFEFWEKLPDKDGVRELANIEVTCDEPKLNYKSERDQRNLKKSKKNEGLLGEEYEVDKSDPLIYEFLSKSLQQIDLNSPEENKFKVKEVILATKQLAEGDLWKIKVLLVLSDCTKNDVTDWDQCGDLQGAEPKTCVIKIWDRPWIKQGRETRIACENQKKEYTFRSKRSSQPEKKLSELDDHGIEFEAFEEFERMHNKHYESTEERIYRFSVFSENMKYVSQLNEHEQGTATYGPTKFADMTRKEFSKRLGYRADLRSDNEIDFPQAKIPDVKLPVSFDWRDKNAVAEVKNQGSCGSCWAFSVTGNIEGQYAIKNGQLLEFSEQELVDCDTVDEGCNGGLMDNAYRQIEKLGGLEQEKNYPYDGRNEKCHFNKSLSRVQLSGAMNISSNETDMAKWLLKNGPISIAINANAMQFYVGGVSHPWKFLCNPKSLDHGVLIVGYGIHTYPKFKKSLPYWIVKNSWGASWGEQGYYRVYRGDGTCGVNQTPSSAILK